MPANNSLSTQTWILQDPRPGIPVKPGSAKVSSFNFMGYSSQDHHCLLKDGAGNIIFETYGNVDLSPISLQFDPIWITGLSLEALDSGWVTVTIL